MRKMQLIALLGWLVAPGVVLAQAPPEKNLLAPHVASLNDKKKAVRLKAVRKLGDFGRAASGAVAELGEVMRQDPDEQVATQAARALAQIGRAGVPELIRATRHKRPEVRNRALWALGLMGPESKEAVDALKDALRDPLPNVRVLAAAALGEMGSSAQPAIPALCRALRDREPKVRMQTARALSNLGADALPTITELLVDADAGPEAHLGALQAAAALGKDANPAVGEIAALLKADSVAVRVAAADALLNIGPAAKDAIPSLITTMRDKKGEVQQHAFQALLRIGSADVPGLLATFRKLNAEAHWAFPYILRQFGPKAKDAVKPLIKELEFAEDGQRMSAALALGEIGPDARDAIPALKKAFNKDQNPMVRHSANFALARIMAESPAELARRMNGGIEPIENELRKALAQLPQPQAGPMPWRPLDRQALFDPRYQLPHDRVIDFFLMTSAQFNAMGRAPTLGLCAESTLWSGQSDAHKAIGQFQPAAAAALIRGMHLAAFHDLGFC